MLLLVVLKRLVFLIIANKTKYFIDFFTNPCVVGSWQIFFSLLLIYLIFEFIYKNLFSFFAKIYSTIFSLFKMFLCMNHMTVYYSKYCSINNQWLKQICNV